MGRGDAGQGRCGAREMLGKGDAVQGRCLAREMRFWEMLSRRDAGLGR